MNKLYRLWRVFQECFLQYVAALLLLSMTLLAILEVIRRYGFGVSFEWQQDAVTYGILCGIFLFFGITQTRNAHLQVSALVLLLKEKCGRFGEVFASILGILGRTIGVVLCTYLVWRGLEVVASMIKRERTTESLVFYLWPFYSTFLIGMGLLGISFLFQLWNDIQILFGRPGLTSDLDAHEDSGPIL
jgi:TRAP-type C4-dicarboxylate transport system permease small subunit